MVSYNSTDSIPSENWFEDRLALEQEYRKNPDTRMVSYSFILTFTET